VVPTGESLKVCVFFVLSISHHFMCKHDVIHKNGSTSTLPEKNRATTVDDITCTKIEDLCTHACRFTPTWLQKSQNISKTNNHLWVRFPSVDGCGLPPSDTTYVAANRQLKAFCQNATMTHSDRQADICETPRISSTVTRIYDEIYFW